MSALSIANAAPSERRLTGGILFLLAGLAALGALATNIILPAFPRIGAGLGASPQELGLTLSSFFVAFAFGQILACLYRKLDSTIMVMKSAEDRPRCDAADVLDGAMDRSVFAKRPMSPQLVIISGILRQDPA